MSKFYEELIKQDFYSPKSDEKNISKEAAASMLDSFSNEQLVALAEEFDMLTEKIASGTLEDEILVPEEKPLVEEAETEAEEAEEVEVEKEAAEKEEKKEEPKAEEKKEEPKAEEKKEEKKEEKPAEEKKEEEKEASEEVDFEMIKEAYDLGLEKMAQEGLTTADYAMSQVGDEKLAADLAEMGEKLAFVTGLNPLMVIDDILFSMNEQLSDLEESED